LKTEKEYFGVGCACAGEAFQDEKQWTCYFIAADSDSELVSGLTSPYGN